MTAEPRMLIVGNANSVHLEHRVSLYRDGGWDGPIDLATFHNNPGWNHGEVIRVNAKWPRPLAAAWLWIKILLRGDKYVFCNVQSVGWYAVPTLAVRSPVMATVYGSEVHRRGTSILLRCVQKLLFRKSRVVHVVSAPMKRFMEEEYQLDNVVRIHTGVYVDRLEAARKREASATVEIGLIRSIAPNYRTVEALNALVPLMKADASVRVVLFEGYAAESYLERCRSIIEKNGLSHQVKFVGFLSRDEWFAALARLDVAVSVPVHDQIGASLLEALAVGVPVILTAGSVYEELYGAEGCYFLHQLKDLPEVSMEASIARRLQARSMLPDEFNASVAAGKFGELIDRVFVRGESPEAVLRAFD